MSNPDEPINVPIAPPPAAQPRIAWNLDAPPNLNPWQKFDWSEEHKHLLHTQWGEHCAKKQKLTKALKYLDDALEIDPYDYKTLNLRSQIKRQLVLPSEALKDSKRAVKINPLNVKSNDEYCTALYEKNLFEDCKVKLHHFERKFAEHSGDVLRQRLIVVDENFKDSCGESLLEFFDTNKDVILPKVYELHQKEINIDQRPLWKILKEQGKCDVQSILDKEIELLSAMEIARRERALKVYNQMYINDSWIDVHFLKVLRENKTLLSPHWRGSSQNLKQIVETKYNNVKNYIKMLHARSPVYNERHVMCLDKERCNKTKEANLNEIQYQTRRTMFVILRTVKKLRAEGRLQRLARYVETIMGDYVSIKTNRVMPWKFEFINEIYNTLALAYKENYIIPKKLHKKPLEKKMNALLGLPSDRSSKQHTTFVFGKRHTSHDVNTVDYKLIAFKAFMAHLEKRLRFAKYSIEKSYLSFELARRNLMQNRLLECITWARKAIEETKNCNSFLWRFHSTVLICKAYALLHKLERIEVVLDDLRTQAEDLCDPNLCAFIAICRYVNNQQLYARENSVASKYGKC